MSELEGTPLCLDCFDLLARLPDSCVDLVFADPPYNIGVFKKMPAGEYLEWCERWIAECSRVLAANGAMWVCHSKPDVLVDLSRIVERYGRGRRNWVTWDKYNGADAGQQYVMNKTKLHPQGKRAFDQDAEYLIYHADEGNWTRQCDKERGFIFEPLRAYLDGERQQAGLSRAAIDAETGTSNVSQYWWQQRNWRLPVKQHYETLRRLAPGYFRQRHEDLRQEYKHIRQEYEHLRQEYKHLRYTFNNPGKVSSVWQIPPAKRNGHPTPKPEALLERIILATSNEGDLVLDPFAGSFTTAVSAQRLGRRWIACDIEPDYVKLGEQRLCQKRLTL